MGSRIAERSRPYGLKGGVLWVRVSSAAWAQELGLLVEPIRGELRRRGVAVDEIRFRVGEIDPLLRPRERRIDTPVPVVLALPPALREQVEAVADPDLRRAIEGAIGRNLGFQLLGALRKTQGAERLARGSGASPAPPAAGGRSDPSDRTPPKPASGRRGKP